MARASTELARTQFAAVLDDVLEILDDVLETRITLITATDVASNRWELLAVNDGVGIGAEPGTVLPLDTTGCTFLASGELAEMRVPDMAEADLRIASWPGFEGVSSYVGVPIVLESGRIAGTICSSDPERASFKDVHLKMMHSRPAWSPTVSTRSSGGSRSSGSTSASPS